VGELPATPSAAGRSGPGLRGLIQERWATLALLVGLALISLPGTPPEAAVLHQLVLGGLLLASLRWQVGPLAALALFVAGVDLRLDTQALGSDVLIVTRAAIEHALGGGNPYGVGFPQSTPPGAPYPYGPLALLWYLPPVDARQIELAVSFVILGLLAARGHLLGLAIYACAPVLIHSAGDGSNDTSLGLLLLVGLAVMPRRPLLGSLGIGLAIAFKPTALAWALPVVGWAGVPGLIGLLASAGALWLPAAIAWGPVAIVESIVRAATLHRWPFYSLAYAAQRFDLLLPGWLYAAIALGGSAALAVAGLFRVRSADGVIGWGAAIFLVALFAGYWSTYAYFAALAPIACWRLDDWLAGGADRVRWPGDPIGRLATWLDERWPAVESVAQRRFR
jgi:hypothetical protein